MVNFWQCTPLHTYKYPKWFMIICKVCFTISLLIAGLIFLDFALPYGIKHPNISLPASGYIAILSFYILLKLLRYNTWANPKEKGVN